jgi:serine/threonine protein kinase
MLDKNYNLKIIDFGTTRFFFKDTIESRKVGTRLEFIFPIFFLIFVESNYMAPEIRDIDTKSSATVQKVADIYSLGVVAKEMMDELQKTQSLSNEMQELYNIVEEKMLENV